MFQKICIKPNEYSFPTDIGFIAENLLFYKQVILIVGPDTLQILLNNCNLDILQELVSAQFLKICVPENFLGVISNTAPTGQIINDVCTMRLKDVDTEELLFKGFFHSTGRRGHSKRLTQKLLPFIETVTYDENICENVRHDLSEQAFTKSAILDTIKHYIPDLDLAANQIQYEWVKTSTGYIFQTNLNYEKLNGLIPNNPDGKIINPTGFISNILNTRGDMHLASSLNAEIATTAINTSLMKLRFKELYESITKHQDDIFQFNDFTLSNGYAIREAINSGDREFKDFLEILHKAEKFKSWLENISDDKSILKEYHEAVTKETWIDKLPSKGLRWSFFTGAGLVLDATLTGGLATAIGLGVSLGDAFLLDKVVKGWKPNVFVEKKLKKFINNP